MRFLIGWAFDSYINLRFCIAEAIKQVGYMVDDALAHALTAPLTPTRPNFWLRLRAFWKPSTSAAMPDESM